MFTSRNFFSLESSLKISYIENLVYNLFNGIEIKTNFYIFKWPKLAHNHFCKMHKYDLIKRFKCHINSDKGTIKCIFEYIRTHTAILSICAPETVCLYPENEAGFIFTP